MFYRAGHTNQQHISQVVEKAFTAPAHDIRLHSELDKLSIISIAKPSTVALYIDLFLCTVRTELINVEAPVLYYGAGGQKSCNE